MNRLLTAKEFRSEVRVLAKKHGLDKFSAGISVAGVVVRWKKKKRRR